MNGRRIRPLENPVREYAWGSETAIQDLLGKREWAGRPVAELWMGAHPSAPSMVIGEGNRVSLEKMVREAPESVLGKAVCESFDSRMPFLLKVLAAAQPLSIQAHPNSDQALEGYKRENRMGIPLNGPTRNYRDPRPKPELICALSRFYGLMGFREIREIQDLMEDLLPGNVLSGSRFFDVREWGEGPKALFARLQAMNARDLDRLVGEAAGAATLRSDESALYRWIAALNHFHPGDVGVLSPLLLNFFELAPGEAVYIPAGQPHSYLEGTGIELMADSDNVVRGALTPKHRDVQELLRVVDGTPRRVQKTLPVYAGPCESTYCTPSREFALSVITTLPGRSHDSGHRRGVEILLCTEGSVQVMEKGSADPLHMTKGDSCIIFGTARAYGVEGTGTLYRARSCLPHRDP